MSIPPQYVPMLAECWKRCGWYMEQSVDQLILSMFRVAEIIAGKKSVALSQQDLVTGTFFL